MILDIQTLAHTFTQAVLDTVKNLSQPSLTIVMVGEDGASAVYVRNKIKTCERVGIAAHLLHLPASITQGALQAYIHDLNQDSSVDGILVQSPLPDHLSAQEIFDTIDPKKDVDGFTLTNIARLYSGDETGLIPGTPKGIIKIIESWGQISGKHVVVIGKSTIVGKPLTMLLLHAGATVTVCHSRTKDLATHTRIADIVISAVGKKHLITADMIRSGALVVDVGISVEEGPAGRKIWGDCDTENIAKIADITPVPGGVGPMTIAMLLGNVLLAHSLLGKN